jgi:RNA polymerase sigma-70 factor (ECF subfamily)
MYNDGKEIEKYFLEYYADLCKYCTVRMPNYRPYAEDIANEAFTLLCEKWHDLEKNNIRAWLYRVADNLLKEFVRKRAKEAKEIDYIETMDDIADSNLIYEQNFENTSDNEVEIYKDEILNGLSDKDRQLYDMSYVEKLPHQEIRKELSISEETLKKRIYRLKQKITHAISNL